MTQLIEFPQRQHQEFRRLVFNSVFEGARSQELDIENYISSIYYSGENPPLFSTKHNMQKIYSRFKELIESAVNSDPELESLSKPNKVYLCFRVYLHNICMERRTMPESDTEQYLQDALKEYFQAKAKVLSSTQELKILRYLERLRRRALLQPG